MTRVKVQQELISVLPHSSSRITSPSWSWWRLWRSFRPLTPWLIRTWSSTTPSRWTGKMANVTTCMTQRHTPGDTFPATSQPAHDPHTHTCTFSFTHELFYLFEMLTRRFWFAWSCSDQLMFCVGWHVKDVVWLIDNKGIFFRILLTNYKEIDEHTEVTHLLEGEIFCYI